ncbi:MAG TPA: tetratricopeptide repeat protein, partial [Methylomirabilota bacterium]|nr:tetratricopeptide repeat protein [Methylomirabilota bacterium]
QGKAPEAEAAYRAAIAVSPALPQAHARLGESLARQGRWREAETAYREALRLQPDDARSRIALAAVLRRKSG